MDAPSMSPKPHSGGEFRLTIGGPIAPSVFGFVFNIRRTSFGALSPQRRSRRRSKWISQVREEGLASRMTLARAASVRPIIGGENGGDIIWEIGSGYLVAATAMASFKSGIVRTRSPPPTRSRWSNSR